jgi:CRP-like cAMP-binding protein
MRYAYFPTAGLISLMAITASGGLVELATVAKGGVVGLPIVLHDAIAPYQATVQIAGTALRLRKDVVEAELRRDPALRQLLFTFAIDMVTDISQAVVCHAFHEILHRLCRWLLTASDRLETHTLEVTHEILAQALGVHRPNVSRVAVELQEASAIQCRHGRIVILNRPLLERSACECYRAQRLARSRSAHAPVV